MRTVVRVLANSYYYAFNEDKPLPQWTIDRTALLRAAADDTGTAHLDGVGVRYLLGKSIEIIELFTRDYARDNTIRIFA